MKFLKKKQIQVLLLSLLSIFVAVMLGIITKEGISQERDNAISVFLQNHTPQSILLIYKGVSNIEILLPIILAVSILYLLKHKKRKQAGILLTSGIIALVVPFYIKHIFQIPRPDPSLITHFFVTSDISQKLYSSSSSFGFPSGHVVSYTLILGMVYQLVKKEKFNITVKKYCLMAIIFVISFVGLSRIALGAHVLSQVIAGYLFGFGLLFQLTFLYDQVEKKSSRDA